MKVGENIRKANIWPRLKLEAGRTTVAVNKATPSHLFTLSSREKKNGSHFHSHEIFAIYEKLFLPATVKIVSFSAQPDFIRTSVN